MTSDFVAWKDDLLRTLRSNPPKWVEDLLRELKMATLTFREDVYDVKETLLGEMFALKAKMALVERVLSNSQVMADSTLTEGANAAVSLEERVEEIGGAVEQLHSTSDASATAKVEVPKPKSFDGVRDPKVIYTFLWKMEQYFALTNNNRESQRIAAAAMYLSGDAILWWRRRSNDQEEGTQPVETWEDFKSELRKQFLSEDVEYQARRELRSLKQTSTIEDYISKFTSLLLCVTGMSDQDKLFSFLSGLKPWVEQELRRRQVQTLANANSIAETITEVEKKPGDYSSSNKEKERDSNKTAQGQRKWKGKWSKEREGQKSGGTLRCFELSQEGQQCSELGVVQMLNAFQSQGQVNSRS